MSAMEINTLQNLYVWFPLVRENVLAKYTFKIKTCLYL